MSNQKLPKLSRNIRARLKDWVYNNVQDEGTYIALIGAQSAAYISLRNVIANKYDQSEMRILDKYDCAKMVSNISIRLKGFYNDQSPMSKNFYIPENAFIGACPLVPDHYNSLHFEFEPATVHMYDCFQNVDKCEQEKERATKPLWEAFCTIIDEAKKMDDICKVWPFALEILNIVEPQNTDIEQAKKVIEDYVFARGVNTTEHCEDE